MPHVEFKEEITGEDAEDLKAWCPMGVFDIEDSHLIAKNPWNCTTCWECIWEDKFSSKIKLQKIKDHFEFTVESVGQIPPERIVFEALKVLKEKAEHWKDVLEEMDDD